MDTHQSMAMEGSTSNMTHNSSHPMNMNMNMPAVFNLDTKITIFFTGWTTTSVTQYILTLVFFFVLAIFNRFLGALRFQLEHAWSSAESENLKHRDVSRKRFTSRSKRGPLPVYTHVSEHSEDSISMDPRGSSKSERETSGSSKSMFFSWKSSGGWSFGKDGMRGLLELVRAGIGYLLMLAVMSFNVGVLAAVLLGIFCGELALGRFTQGMGWQEGSHDG